LRTFAKPKLSTSVCWDSIWYFVIHLPNDDELGKVADRMRKAGLALRKTSEGWLARDPSQNGILLAAAARFPS
jgi:hypothetical protein